jgi:Ni/Co efflux regulator RcnB
MDVVIFIGMVLMVAIVGFLALSIVEGSDLSYQETHRVRTPEENARDAARAAAKRRHREARIVVFAHRAGRAARKIWRRPE